MKKPIDHKHKKGGNFEAKPPRSAEVLLRMSERMKEFNRKTGKVTAMGNRLSQRRKKPKG